MAVTIERDGRGWVLTAQTGIPSPPERVFPFFGDAANLDRITPPSLRFRILTPCPIEMRRGALIDYALRVRGVPVRWRTEITAWDPPRGFTDEQIRGPYRWWRHHHVFDAADSGTRMTDTVEYGVPGGWLVHEALVRRDVGAIFRFREREIRAVFAPGHSLDASPAAP